METEPKQTKASLCNRCKSEHGKMCPDCGCVCQHLPPVATVEIPTIPASAIPRLVEWLMSDRGYGKDKETVGWMFWELHEYAQETNPDGRTRVSIILTAALEAFNAREVEQVEYTAGVRCPACDGLGQPSVHSSETCLGCGGSGWSEPPVVKREVVSQSITPSDIEKAFDSELGPPYKSVTDAIERGGVVDVLDDFSEFIAKAFEKRDDLAPFMLQNKRTGIWFKVEPMLEECESDEPKPPPYQC